MSSHFPDHIKDTMYANLAYCCGDSVEIVLGRKDAKGKEAILILEMHKTEVFCFGDFFNCTMKSREVKAEVIVYEIAFEFGVPGTIINDVKIIHPLRDNVQSLCNGIPKSSLPNIEADIPLTQAEVIAILTNLIGTLPLVTQHIVDDSSTQDEFFAEEDAL